MLLYVSTRCKELLNNLDMASTRISIQFREITITWGWWKGWKSESVTPPQVNNPHHPSLAPNSALRTRRPSQLEPQPPGTDSSPAHVIKMEEKSYFETQREALIGEIAMVSS